MAEANAMAPPTNIQYTLAMYGSVGRSWPAWDMLSEGELQIENARKWQ